MDIELEGLWIDKSGKFNSMQLQGEPPFLGLQDHVQLRSMRSSRSRIFKGWIKASLICPPFLSHIVVY
jgi:hypothetical protein